MFEVGRATSGDGELPRVDLEETSAVLEIGLPYVYPGRVDPFKLSWNTKASWYVISMFDKYEVSCDRCRESAPRLTFPFTLADLSWPRSGLDGVHVSFSVLFALS